MSAAAIFRRRSILAIAAALSLGACSGQTTTAPAPSTPAGGWLTVQLTTPNRDDGAIQLSIIGPKIDSVKLVGYDGFDINNGTQAELVATGDIVGGDVVRIFIPDLSRTGEYAASVSAAAVRGTFALQTLDGYRAVLVR